MLYQRWIRFGIMSTFLVAVPLQNAFALGAQWRPLKSISPVSHQVQPRMLRGATDARFRPVQPQVRHTPRNAFRYAPAAVPPQQVFRAPQVRAPAFARQYAWRPAPSRWTPRRVAANQRPVRAVRQPVSNDGRWRPVAAPAPVYQRMAPPPQFARVPQRNWRPVARFQPMPPAARNGYYAQSAGQAYPAQRMRQPRQPRAPRFPAYAGYPPVSPYMPQPYMAGYYRPAPPMYPNPYMAPAQRPWMPYGGMPPRFQPPQPMWGWAGPAYGVMGPRPGWPPAPAAGNGNSSYLAGCPGC